MKIRNGFISNSSSTSFMIMVKDDDLDSIEEVLNSNKIAFENIPLTISDIIDSFIDNLESDRKIFYTDFPLTVENDNLNRLKHTTKSNFIPLDLIVEKSIFISYLMEAKKIGLEYLALIEFGDHGEVDTEVSDIMENHLVRYKSKDLFIYSEFTH